MSGSERRDGTKVRLLYANRTPDDILARETLETWHDSAHLLGCVRRARSHKFKPGRTRSEASAPLRADLYRGQGDLKEMSAEQSRVESRLEHCNIALPSKPNTGERPR